MQSPVEEERGRAGRPKEGRPGGGGRMGPACPGAGRISQGQGPFMGPHYPFVTLTPHVSETSRKLNVSAHTGVRGRPESSSIFWFVSL